MKNIILLMILILIMGALAYWSKNNYTNGKLTQSIQSNVSISSKLPKNNTYGQIEKLDNKKTAEIIRNNSNNSVIESSQSHSLAFSAPKTTEFTLPAIYPDQTQENEKTETEKNFKNWRKTVENQGFSFNNTQDMENLKKIRMEFLTLREIKNKQNTKNLNQYIEDTKNRLRQNNAMVISDNILLGDLWEITYQNNLEEESPLLLKKFIESFYIIPLKKEIEIANLAQNNLKDENLYYSSFFSLLNNSFFAPIGSELESHTPIYETGPQQGIDCGGGTEVSNYPPGSSFYASSCDSCSKNSKSCRKLCGACSGSTGYLWDSVTGICGCGQ
ncbi:MAG: hypothetical protein US76_00875 [Parcubacteria group bacterium GW2011_GWA2_38_13b]|nr:MAG: hypothetical protein US76_00875 [Parcubacteria group bacterium GW2011_GWA2_38_13b]